MLETIISYAKLRNFELSKKMAKTIEVHIERQVEEGQLRINVMKYLIDDYIEFSKTFKKINKEFKLTQT
jgi:hypothetical protein